MESSCIQGLLKAIPRYDREIEPLEFRIDSYRLELKLFLDSLVERWTREHSDDPEFLDRIHSYMERIRKRVRSTGTGL